MIYNFAKWLTAILFSVLFVGVVISFFTPFRYLFPVEIIALALLFYVVEAERNKKFGIALLTALVADIPILFGWVDGEFAAVLLIVMHIGTAYAAYLIIKQGLFLVTKSAALMLLISHLIVGLVFLFLLFESQFNAPLWNNASKVFLLAGCVLGAMNSFQNKFGSLSSSGFNWEIAVCVIVIAILFHINGKMPVQSPNINRVIEANHPERKVQYNTSPSDNDVDEPAQFKPREHPEFIQNPDGSVTVIDIAGIEHNYMSMEMANSLSDVFTGFPIDVSPNPYDQMRQEKAEKWRDSRDRRDDAREKYHNARKRGAKSEMERYSKEAKDAQSEMDILSF